MKRLLLDENLPRRLTEYFSSEFSVLTTADLGWQSKENGDLLASMDREGIEFLLTADRNLRFQQNMEKFNVRVVVVICINNRLKTIGPRVGAIEEAINSAAPDLKIVEVDLR